jgi:hypothetical protein
VEAIRAEHDVEERAADAGLRRVLQQLGEALAALARKASFSQRSYASCDSHSAVTSSGPF